MAQALIFHSVLGVRAGVTDLADALSAAGHTPVVVDQYDGRVFDAYEPAGAYMESVGLPALMSGALEEAKGVTGPFVAVGFSNGAGMAEWVAANRPEDALGVVMVGGGIPMRFLEATWPPGVPGQVHVTAEDPFHEEDRQFDDELQDDVEHAGGEFAFVEYQGAGHLFSDPTFSEYQPEEARILTRRVIEFVDRVGAGG